MGEVVVLLGAGASRDAGLPTTNEMTNRLVGLLRSGSAVGDSKTWEVVNFVLGQLLAQAGAQGQDVLGSVDVERLMNALELLGERGDLELSPFVYSWHPRVDDLEQPRTKRTPTVPQFTGSKLRRALESRHGDRELEDVLNEVIKAAVTPSRPSLLDRRDGIYKVAFRNMEAALVRVLASPTGVAHLAPLLSLVPDDGALAIATLNYDRTLELLAESRSVPCATGVDEWSQTLTWSWPPRGIRLLKLHGSIDWSEHRERQPSGFAQIEVRTVDVAEDRHWSPLLIFGGRNKLRADGPFLGLLAQFDDELSAARTLLVVGYSFRDPHVNEVIRRWAGRDDSRRVILVDPALDRRPRVPRPPIGFVAELLDALAGAPSRQAPRPHRNRGAASPIPDEPELIPGREPRAAIFTGGAAADLSAAVALAMSTEAWPVPEAESEPLTTNPYFPRTWG